MQSQIDMRLNLNFNLLSPSSFLILAGVFMLFLASCAPAAKESKEEASCGFVQNVYGERISWKGKLPIEIYVDASVPSSFREVIQRAAQTWSSAARKSLFVIHFTSSSQPLIRGDGRNVISFLSEWEAGRESEQGRTTLSWIGDEIRDADIRINGKNFVYYTGERGERYDAVNLEALVLHELGHVLGLKHDEASTSVMATYLPAQTNRTELTPTEKDSLTCEYL